MPPASMLVTVALKGPAPLPATTSGTSSMPVIKPVRPGHLLLAEGRTLARRRRMTWPSATAGVDPTGPSPSWCRCTRTRALSVR